MNKLLFFIFLTCTISANAQRCGSGIFSVKIFVQNGERLKNIKYELIPITKEQMDRLFSKSLLIRETQARLLSNLNGGVFINPALIDIAGFVKTHQAVATPPEAFANEAVLRSLTESSKRFGLGGIKLMGNIKNGALQFATLETYYKLFLLKFSANGYTGYLVANFFGGCNNTVNIIWNKSRGFSMINENYY